MTMREIKGPRVWDDVLGKMLYSKFEQYDDSIGFRFSEHLETESPVYMWPTGLKDKKEREMYEGDIYKFKHVLAFRKWWKNLDEKREIDAKFEEELKNAKTVYGEIVFEGGEFKLKFHFGSIPVKTISRGESSIKKSHFHGESEERYFDFEYAGTACEHPHLLEVEAT